MERAVASLARAVDRAVNSTGDEELRDAVIQRFEYTFELCWKMIKRRLEVDLPSPSDVDLMSYNAMVREAGERGLVKDVRTWMVNRDQSKEYVAYLQCGKGP